MNKSEIICRLFQAGIITKEEARHILCIPKLIATMTPGLAAVPTPEQANRHIAEIGETNYE